MKRIIVLTALLVAQSLWAVASVEDEMTSLSYISYLERYATVQPAAQDETIEAVINLPLVAGDRIDTAREARVEVVLSDGTLVWLDEYTSVSFDAVAFSRDTGSDRSVLFVAEGGMMVEVFENGFPRKPMRIDSRTESLHLTQPGLYRIETTGNGGLRLEVWKGLAEAATSRGGVLVRTEYAAEIRSGQVSQMERYRTVYDDFARWVDQRRSIDPGESVNHVDLDYARQASQLDNYGNWVYLENDNAWAWQPNVTNSWRPYTFGRWYWTNTGWNWVSYEPWGWLPYHYGNWFYTPGHGWVWSWNSYWSPAWVHWVHWPGYVGWCPVGYYSHWWGHHYGWYHDDWWYDGGYGGHHGGPGRSGSPPRDHVVPRSTSSTLAPARRAAVPKPEDIGLELSGRVRVADLDGNAWNVVSTDDFASARLARVVKPGDLAVRNSDALEGTVRSGVLRTASPWAARTPDELERSFQNTATRARADLSPIIARDSSVPTERALSLVKPAEVRTLASSGASSRPVGTEAPPTRTTTTVRRDTPNLYRPTSDAQQSSPVLSGSRLQSSTGSAGGSLRTGSLSESSGRTIEVRPGSSSATRSSEGRSLAGRSSSTGSSLGSSSSSSSSSRPIIVPRTSTTRSYSPSSGRSSSGSSLGSSSSSSRSSIGSSSSSRSSSRSSSATSSSSRSRSSGSSASRSSSSRSSSSRSSASASRPSSRSSASSSSSSSSSSSKKR